MFVVAAPFEKVQVQIVEHEKHHPNEMLIAMNKDNPQLHDKKQSILKIKSINYLTYSKTVADTFFFADYLEVPLNL